MKKVLTLSAGILLTGLLSAPVNAAQNDPPAAPNEATKVQNALGQTQTIEQNADCPQSNPNDPALSLDARYKKRIEIKNRALEMREKLIREEQQQQPPQ